MPDHQVHEVIRALIEDFQLFPFMFVLASVSLGVVFAKHLIRIISDAGWGKSKPVSREMTFTEGMRLINRLKAEGAIDILDDGTVIYPTDKLKNDEQDEVVGIGDDGEFVYASEKLKNEDIPDWLKD